MADRTEILQFLTGLLRGELAENEKSVRERLKAAELLGKGCGAFEPEITEKPPLKVEIEILNGKSEQPLLWLSDSEQQE